MFTYLPNYITDAFLQSIMLACIAATIAVGSIFLQQTHQNHHYIFPDFL